MLKKISLFLAMGALLALSANKMSAQTVIAQGTTGSLTWVLTDDSVMTISGSGAMPDYDENIPPWDNFYGGIKSIIIGDSVTTIGISAFYGLSYLTSVTIGKSVTTIGNYAFYNCSSLTSVTIGDSVTSIGDDVFFGCNNLTIIAVGANNPNYSSDNGVLFNKNQTTLIQCPAGKSGTYSIPNSVTTIGNWAFAGCSSLTSVTIPDSVTTIEESAFYYCSGLTSVTIGNSVTTIGEYAFLDCISLASMYVNTAMPPQIGNYTFYAVSQTIPVYVPCGQASDYQNDPYWNYFTNIIDDAPAISVQSNDIAMGTAAVTQQNTCTNDQAVIEATPNAGYRFVQWNDGITHNPRTITVTQDTAFVAEFALIITYQVTVTANDNTMGSVSGAGGYPQDSVVTIGAVPNAGYQFVQWNDGITTNPRTITVTQDTAFVAEFEAIGNSIAETNGNTSVQLFPNPVSNGQLTISNGEGMAEIYTVQGVRVGSYSLTDKETSIDISHLASGVYFVKVGNTTRKLIVSR
jgi:hypothetical protein